MQILYHCFMKDWYGQRKKVEEVSHFSEEKMIEEIPDLIAKIKFMFLEVMPHNYQCLVLFVFIDKWISWEYHNIS